MTDGVRLRERRSLVLFLWQMGRFFQQLCTVRSLHG